MHLDWRKCKHLFYIITFSLCIIFWARDGTGRNQRKNTNFSCITPPFLNKGMERLMLSSILLGLGLKGYTNKQYTNPAYQHTGLSQAKFVGLSCGANEPFFGSYCIEHP